MKATPPLPARAQETPADRVDGKLKVAGTARYAAEFLPTDAAHAFLVMSSISKGTIAGIDTGQAMKAPGVLEILTHQNAPKLQEPPNDKEAEGIRIEQRIPLSDRNIHYGGQYIAMVIADTIEHARHAAGLIKVECTRLKPALTKGDPDMIKRPAKNMGEDMQATKGDVDQALADTAFVKIEQTYTTPTEMHHPMECSATVAIWEGTDRLTLCDSTQYVQGTQAIVAHAFGLKRENVRVICPFVGGAFGCKGPVWPHTFLAAMGAKAVGRPVRVELTRAQMFSGTGHRPETSQTVALAADHEGKLQAVRHLHENPTSPVGQWIEPAAWAASSVMYDAPAVGYRHTIYETNIAQPSFMRAPGECPGTYALECAIDELACALRLDPVKLRLNNNSPNHPMKGIPFSTKNLDQCYAQGAEKFGWDRRSAEPGSMRDGNLLVGWGVATATYPAHQWNAKATVRIDGDGTALARCAGHDLGTGAYTVLTQIAADALGLPLEKVRVELGDSALPHGPVAGGSNTTATVGSAITDAARNLGRKFAELAVKQQDSPLSELNPEDLNFAFDARLVAKSDAAKSDIVAEILRRAGLRDLEAGGEIEERKKPAQAFQSFGAQFCEVKIDPEFPLVRVTRFVSVMDCGRVINPKTGGSQILGGVVMGIGMALHEQTIYDPETGLPATR
ncbi:MAG TPA: xanthine dehydrogenase family protein molybdopterin-binding subunit, partial [Verrucomicrobiaceae bacterium]